MEFVSMELGHKFLKSGAIEAKKTQHLKVECSPGPRTVWTNQERMDSCVREQAGAPARASRLFPACSGASREGEGPPAPPPSPKPHIFWGFPASSQPLGSGAQEVQLLLDPSLPHPVASTHCSQDSSPLLTQLLGALGVNPMGASPAPFSLQRPCTVGSGHTGDLRPSPLWASLSS